MFTGLIETVGRLVAIDRRGAAAILTVAGSLPAEEIALGESVAVNGVCLTVTAKTPAGLLFDLSPETFARTTFATARPGMAVNLERALRLSDRLGGHLVTGHVDCIGTVLERRGDVGSTVFGIALPGEHLRYVVPKGSITVDGVSLTVNRVTNGGFTLNVIPATAAATTLGKTEPGDRVNIETDIVGKYIERLLADRPAGATPGVMRELLEKSGFM